MSSEIWDSLGCQKFLLHRFFSMYVFLYCLQSPNYMHTPHLHATFFLRGRLWARGLLLQALLESEATRPIFGLAGGVVFKSAGNSYTWWSYKPSDKYGSKVVKRGAGFPVSSTLFDSNRVWKQERKPRISPILFTQARSHKPLSPFRVKLRPSSWHAAKL